MAKSVTSFSAVLSLFALLVTAPRICEAQTYSYRTYNAESGLPGSYISVIAQDQTGFLWVGLETGLFRFDGFEFHRVEMPDTISTGYPNALFSDTRGTMWVGMTDGSLFTWQQGSTLKRVASVEADKINQITSDPGGKVWIVTQTKGIYTAEAGGPEKISRIATPEGIVIFDLSFVSSDSLLVATQDNLHLCRLAGDEVIVSYSLPELEYTWVHTVQYAGDDTWLAGTDGAGLFVIRKEKDVMKAYPAGKEELEGIRIPVIIHAADGSLLLATRERGVLKVSLADDNMSAEVTGRYNTTTGLPGDDVRTIFSDREGNLWIGLFNQGLAAVTTNAFSFYIPATGKEINYIGEREGKVILGNRNGMGNFDPSTGLFGGYRNLNVVTGGTGIISWLSDRNGELWIGTTSEGLWKISSTGNIKPVYRSQNPGQNHINSIAVDEQNIWLGTLNGVILLDRNSGVQRAEYTTREMLQHNNISQVVSTRENEILVATETDRLCYIHTTGGVRNEGEPMEGIMRNRVQSIALGHDGTICAGTLGNGLYLFRGDTLMNFTSSDGLLSNYCYSVLIASDGKIWIGHEKGFSVVNPAQGSIRTFDRQFGVTGDCLSNAIAETTDGRIYIGTTDGIVVYNPEMDRKQEVAPQAAVISVKINNTEYPYRHSYTLPYRSSYTVEVNYAGLSLRDPLNVAYRTKLDNFDEEWGETTMSRSVTYKISDGHYRFNVEAKTIDGSAGVSEASFDLQIQSPFTRSWWFILSLFIVAAGIVWIIIELRERAHRKQTEYLEGELRKRTAEVFEQKEELAQKNIDITESIKYAKRIQSSVLPDTARLSSVFADAFVFFLPRDIVSGDFYWFDWIDKDRFILVCADSTGHGVPGAFMSMIGTALLQDIITVKKITRPSQILHELDRQIFSTLNQNQELEASNDGMDIIVCEFNIRTRHLVFASAMRPVILIIDGEQQYVRGNRSSVGGESVTEKYYDDQEYHLREGDIVYLFTDGYPDQFGGYAGKKMKISRLRMLFDEVKGLTMVEQDQRIRDFFYEWKGDSEQVDDVLMMGIKI